MDSLEARDDLDPALPFELLLHALRAGDGETWACVLDRLLPRATSAIRRSFGSAVAGPHDAGGDAVASACRTIYRNLREGKFELEDWNDLTALFIRIALHKCSDRLRKDRRLVPLTDLGTSEGSGASASLLDRPGPDCSPLEQVLRREARQDFLRVVDLVRRRLERKHKKWRAIFNLRLEGTYTVADIARQVGCTEHAVKRVWHEAVELIRQLLQESSAEELTG